MSPDHPKGTIMDYGFPRVSGDEPVVVDLSANAVEFSPRERG